MNAWAYLRKSSLPPGVQSMSPQAQEDAVRALARVHSQEIAAEHILADWDVSGSAKHTAKRVNYLRLCDAIASGQVSVVYSYSLSRIARSLTEVLKFFDLCAEHGVPVRLVADSVDTSTASGRMLLRILATVAEFESEVASERRLAANQAKRDRGERIVTDKPFGDKPGEDAEAVVSAFREAHSYGRAARLLNARGVRPRRAKTWRASSVVGVIQRVAPELIVPGTTKRTPAGGQPFVLARLLRCGTCEGMLTGKHNKGRVLYQCSRGGPDHPKTTVTESTIIQRVQDEVLKAEKLVVNRTTSDPTARDRINDERERLRDMFQGGHVDKADFAKRMEKLAEREAKLPRGRMTVWLWPVLVGDDADSPLTANVKLRRIFERIDVDPVTFQPTHFEWTEEATA